MNASLTATERPARRLPVNIIVQRGRPAGCHLERHRKRAERSCRRCSAGCAQLPPLHHSPITRPTSPKNHGRANLTSSVGSLWRRWCFLLMEAAALTTMSRRRDNVQGSNYVSARRYDGSPAAAAPADAAPPYVRPPPPVVADAASFWPSAPTDAPSE